MESEKINTHLSNSTIHPTFPARCRTVSLSKTGRMVRENVFDTFCMMNLLDTMNMIFSLHALAYAKDFFKTRGGSSDKSHARKFRNDISQPLN